MSVFGVWTRMPRQNAERAIRVMDAVNCLSKAVVFVALSQVKIRIHAFKHIVGQHTDNQHLEEQIQTELPHEHANDHGIRTRNMVNICIGSKFDSNGSLYEVVEVLPNRNILSICRWIGNVGSGLTLSCEDVLQLVNEKRG
jgi:hypothetical protein